MQWRPRPKEGTIGKEWIDLVSKVHKKKKKKTPGCHTINIGKLRSRLGVIETRFLQGVQEDSYAAICTLVEALEEKTPSLDYCLECKEKSPEEETELAEKMFAQICKESRVAAIFDGVSLERETCKSCGTIINHYQSFRNLTLPVVGLELFVDIVCVHNSSFVISLSLPISAKVRTLKYLLNEELHKSMDELCLRYVNLESNRANELVIVVNDCDDISNFITKKKGFFCACQVVDIIRPPSNSLEKEKDQFIIIPVLQCVDNPDDYDYNYIRYCKVSRGSQYNSEEIVQELGCIRVDEQSLHEAALFYGDKQIDIAKKQSFLSCFFFTTRIWDDEYICKKNKPKQKDVPLLCKWFPIFLIFYKMSFKKSLKDFLKNIVAYFQVRKTNQNATDDEGLKFVKDQ
ncbi:hypothetical protein RFI_35613, partial [Reticulomyxa filosa]